MNSEQLDDWEKGIADYRLPRWNELPEIAFYMDQIITFTEKRLAYILGDGGGKLITPSMINNYVKLKIIPPPVRKRYSKEHIAFLMIICSLKSVMSIPSIKELIERRLVSDSLPTIYDEFCDEQETASKVTADKAHKEYVEVLDAVETPEKAMCILATRHAVYANVEKLLSERIAQKVTGV